MSQEVDNSKSSKKDSLAIKFAWQDNVKLSDAQAILGESETQVDDKTKLLSHSWDLIFIGSPQTGDINYNASNGYCIQTRSAVWTFITYTWKPEISNKAYGFLMRSESYY